MAGTPVAEFASWLDTLLDASKFRLGEPENGLVVDPGPPVRRIEASLSQRQHPRLWEVAPITRWSDAAGQSR